MFKCVRSMVWPLVFFSVWSTVADLGSVRLCPKSVWSCRVQPNFVRSGQYLLCGMIGLETPVHSMSWVAVIMPGLSLSLSLSSLSFSLSLSPLSLSLSLSLLSLSLSLSCFQNLTASKHFQVIIKNQRMKLFLLLSTLKMKRLFSFSGNKNSAKLTKIYKFSSWEKSNPNFFFSDFLFFDPQLD